MPTSPLLSRWASFREDLYAGSSVSEIHALGSWVNRGNLDGEEAIYAPNYVGHDRRDRTYWKPKVIYLSTTGFTRKRDRGELLVFIEDS